MGRQGCEHTLQMSGYASLTRPTDLLSFLHLLTSWERGHLGRLLPFHWERGHLGRLAFAGWKPTLPEGSMTKPH